MMKSSSFVVLLVCLAVTLLAACNNLEQNSNKRETDLASHPGEPSRVAPYSERDELTMSGELKEVDLLSRRFVLIADNGAERTFSFFDYTDVASDGGSQGLSAQRGSHIKVVYNKIGDLNRAVRIEVTSK